MHEVLGFVFCPVQVGHLKYESERELQASIDNGRQQSLSGEEESRHDISKGEQHVSKAKATEQASRREKKCARDTAAKRGTAGKRSLVSGNTLVYTQKCQATNKKLSRNGTILWEPYTFPSLQLTIWV